MESPHFSKEKAKNELSSSQKNLQNAREAPEKKKRTDMIGDVSVKCG